MEDRGLSSFQKLAQYYAERATEYEKIYLKPERQQSLSLLKSWVSNTFSRHHVLEVACRTGFWTQAIVATALSIVATDVNSEVLKIAQSKPISSSKVRFVQHDAFSRKKAINAKFTAGFAGFWWSHIPKSELERFLDRFHSNLLPGSVVVFIDNLYVEGNSTPITRVDEEGSFQERRLENGTTYEVMKNFPTEIELKHLLEPTAMSIQYEQFNYYWGVSYNLANAP